MTIQRPDLLDYEGQRQFIVTIEAFDLVTPESARRHVRDGAGTSKHNVYSFVCPHRTPHS